MPTRQRGGGSAAEGPPTTFPEGTPPPVSHDHSWTLQSVMQMQRELGTLIERIDGMRNDVTRARDEIKTLTTRVDTGNQKIDKINMKLAWLAGICAGITGVVLIVWAVVTQVPWDKLISARSGAAVEKTTPNNSPPFTNRSKSGG